MTLLLLSLAAPVVAAWPLWWLARVAADPGRLR